MTGSYWILSKGMTKSDFHVRNTTLAKAGRWIEGMKGWGQEENIRGYFSNPAGKIEGLINMVVVTKRNGYLGTELVAYWLIWYDVSN